MKDIATIKQQLMRQEELFISSNYEIISKKSNIHLRKISHKENLHFKIETAQDCDLFVSALQSLPHLSCLNLTSVGEQFFEKIFEFLPPSLTYLDLSQTSIPSSAMQFLSQSIAEQKMPALNFVSLERGKIKDADMLNFLDSLKQLQTPSLGLLLNEIESESPIDIIKKIGSLEHLSSLTISFSDPHDCDSNNRYSHAFLDEICDAFAENLPTALTFLDLSHNQIADEGAPSIAKGIKKLKQLTSLNLSYNAIDAKGSILIFTEQVAKKFGSLTDDFASGNGGGSSQVSNDSETKPMNYWFNKLEG